MSRAMLMTVLARLDGVDAAGSWLSSPPGGAGQRAGSFRIGRSDTGYTGSELLMAVGAVTAGVDVVFHPAAPVRQEPLKNCQRLFPALVVIQLPAIVELMPGLQNFSRVQLGLVDPQVAIWIAGACFAVGDGEISIKNLSLCAPLSMTVPGQRCAVSWGGGFFSGSGMDKRLIGTLWP